MVSDLAAQTTDGYAKIVRIKGAARYSQPGGTWNQAPKVGDVLPPGTVVQTGMEKGSYMDIVLVQGDAVGTPMTFNAGGPTTAAAGSAMSFRSTSEQNIVRVTENTALGIDKLTVQNTGADLVTDTQLDLKKGRIVGNVKKMSPASRYEIKIPNGVAGIRGTLFDLSSAGVLAVGRGTVVLAFTKDGVTSTQVVTANELYDALQQQLTTLTASQVNYFNAILQQMGFTGPVTTSSTISLDQTVRRVSPTTGDQGSGGGEGGGVEE
jgi:hypothetical protein